MSKSLVNKCLTGSLLATTLCVAGVSANAAPSVNQGDKGISQINENDNQGVNQSTRAPAPTPRVNSKTTPIFYGTDSEYPFSKAVRAGNTLYMSGELGMKDGKVVEGGVKAETAQALDNINQTLLSYGYQSSDLVKCMVMMADMKDFGGFNEVYKAKLSKPYPVRSAFAVKELALGANVEIECMAVK